MGYSVTFSNYVIGEDAYDRVAQICGGYGTRVLLVGGKTAMQKAKPALESAIANSALELVDSVVYGHECTHAQAEKIAALCAQLDVDMVFGMGGGKALDTAKSAANIAHKPVFTFPTIAATCAATTALSVVYREDGSFEDFDFFETPAVYSFINTAIIANAPVKFLRAGMGDTIAKHFECCLSSRNDELAHSSALAREISTMCYKPLLQYGKQALADCEANRVSAALQEAVLAVVVSTGLVSLLVAEEYNGAIAHSLFYALATIPGFEKNYLHGDVVAYGVLVQLAIDENWAEFANVYNLLLSLGIQTTLAEMQVPLNSEYLAPILKETLAGPDMQHLPYPVSEQMVYDAIVKVEQYKNEENIA